jgi:Fic family protein
MEKFKPKYTITQKVARDLMRIEAVKQSIINLPMTVSVQKRLRETARLVSTHYSTEIEGNRLTLEQAERVIHNKEHFPGRKRDEQEVLGYYKALDEIEMFVADKKPVTEELIKTLHGLVIGGNQKRIKPTEYRDAQNVIKDSISGGIVYMPPEAKDVSSLMASLVDWIDHAFDNETPPPLIAGIAHYQFATIHPYYDGNGRTARLLTTYIMHLGGYDLKGVYSLEEYYSKNLSSYYQALTIGPSHNYYMGRAEADITLWMEYFIEGAAEAFESVLRKTKDADLAGEKDKTALLRKLDARQRKAIALFQDSDWITSSDLAALFNIKPRTARDLCLRWCDDGFITVFSSARKNRKYALSESFRDLQE